MSWVWEKQKVGRMGARSPDIADGSQQGGGSVVAVAIADTVDSIMSNVYSSYD